LDAARIEVPDLALVVMVGAAGAGKSTFAQRCFRETEVLSSDAFRAMVRDDAGDMGATGDAFDVLHLAAAKRLAAGRLTVVDATNVTPWARRPLVALARAHHVAPVAIVLDLPEETCLARDGARGDRAVGSRTVRAQRRDLARALGTMAREGFAKVHVLASPREAEAAEVVRVPLPCDRRADPGPFDVVGDVHGCRAELEALLGLLGWDVPARRHPDGRRLVFLGDLVDRGPDVPGVLRLAMELTAAGAALCVPGNHDAKLARKLAGRNVRVARGLAATLEQLAAEPPAFAAAVAAFFDALPSHYVLDRGRLVVAHAGLKEAMHGRDGPRVRDFALYGDTPGEVDAYGLPVRLDWAADYAGAAAVVYGHTPVVAPEWVNGTIDIDTGCVFGGRLTALRWPERTLVSVPAERQWWTPTRPLR
jgi:polynucleotide kinase-phosphatase